MGKVSDGDAMTVVVVSLIALLVLVPLAGLGACAPAATPTAQAQQSIPRDTCVPSDFGNGVYLFRCSAPSVQTSEFANALSAFVKSHPDIEVTTVSPMPATSSSNKIDGYLVVTRPL